MVYNFRGRVKVSEVQAAFNDMIAKINNLRQKYEEALGATNYTLDIGAATLAPDRYSLSVGGLKQIISDLQGCIIGARIYKYGNTFVCSNGIAFTQGGIFKIKPQIISGNGDYVILSNPTTGVVSRVAHSGIGTNLLVAKIETDGANGICELVTAIGDASSKKIFCGNNATAYDESQPRDKNTDCFIGFSLTDRDHDKNLPILFNGVEIGRTWRPGKRNSKYGLVWQHFFLPKGVPNPFQITQGIVQKIFPVIKK